MRNVELHELATGYGLVEGPTWDGTGLLFSDVVGGGLFRLRPDGNVDQMLAHRRGMGGVALHADGGYVVSGRNVAHKTDSTTTVLLDGEPAAGRQSFNDLTADDQGRVYVGSLDMNPLDSGSPVRPGKLHRIELDGSATTLSDDVLLSNGLGFSPDRRSLYHSDSRRGVVWRFALDLAGEVTGRTEFASFDEGVPDGLAVATDGTVWVAVAHAAHVAALDPDGALRARIDTPVPMATSVCFGGDELQDLYVVTGSSGAPPEVGGGVYVVRDAGPGLPVPPARVRAAA
jgi:D-xylonolactonase